MYHASLKESARGRVYEDELVLKDHMGVSLQLKGTVCEGKGDHLQGSSSFTSNAISGTTSICARFSRCNTAGSTKVSHMRLREMNVELIIHVLLICTCGMSQ